VTYQSELHDDYPRRPGPQWTVDNVSARLEPLGLEDTARAFESAGSTSRSARPG
jgi:hypothetical protein